MPLQRLIRDSLQSLLVDKINLHPNFKYTVQESSKNKNVLCVKVQLENQELEDQFLIVKILSRKGIETEATKYFDDLKSAVTFRNGHNELYLVCHEKNIGFPCVNNFLHLKIILQSLADFQTSYLANCTTNDFKKQKVEHISNSWTLLEIFKKFDNNLISNTFLKLKETISELHQSCFLVPRISSINENNVMIANQSKGVFLNVENEEFTSPVYDALMFIFALSDEEFRQKYFKKLLSLYYEAFTSFAQQINNNTLSEFDINTFEKQVKVFLPVVKFETVEYLYKNKESLEHKQNYLKHLIDNISYSLNFPQLSYEDCLEAVSKRLGSTDFDLLDYKLVSLSEKNGHLGQYLILKCKVKVLDKLTEFDMFVKILYTDNVLTNAVVESGPSEKEQFFYRTLMPLFNQYGLESLTTFAPQCYFDRLNDLIILTDLANLGYKSLKPYARLGYDDLRLAFFKAAEFHACTLILEDRMTRSKNTPVRVGDLYGDLLRDWIFVEREGLPRNPASAFDSKPGIDQLIDTFADIPKKFSLEEFHKRVNSIYETFTDRISFPSKKFRNVVCHGDMYASNLLVKYDQHGKPEDCVMIDYQGLRYAPIAQDILMLVYCSTNKDVRDRYLDELLEEYYQELKNILGQFNLDINSFYTPKEFMDCVNYMKPAFILAALCYSQLIAVSPEKREELFFDKDKFQYYFIENRKEYIKYLVPFPPDCEIYFRGLLEDLYNICVDWKC